MGARLIAMIRSLAIMALDIPQALFVRGQAAVGFARYALARFSGDRCLRIAASLSYTSLLAIVPLAAIGLAIMAAFPGFDAARQKLLGLALTYVAPHAGSVVETYLQTFVSNTGGLTAIGVVGLAVTAIMLLATVESAFNAIWRVHEARPLVTRLIAYWTVLTLGPMLLGAGLSLNTYFAFLAQLAASSVDIGALRGLLIDLIPIFFAAAGFTVIYVALPHRKVDWRHALAGGLVAAILFEILKRVFSLYVGRIIGLQAVYGTLSALPLFLIWMYLTWSVILFGAVMAAAWPEWLANRRRAAAGEITRGRRFAEALLVLHILLSAGREGRRINDDSLVAALGGDSEGMAEALSMLRGAGYVARTDNDDLVLSRDLDGVSLYDICQIAGLGPIEPELPELPHIAWAPELRHLLASTDDQSRGHLTMPIKALFADKTASGTASLRPRRTEVDAD